MRADNAVEKLKAAVSNKATLVHGEIPFKPPVYRKNTLDKMDNLQRIDRYKHILLIKNEYGAKPTRPLG